MHIFNTKSGSLSVCAIFLCLFLPGSVCVYAYVCVCVCACVVGQRLCNSFFFFLFYLKSFQIYDLDSSYNYHANNMYQQAAPIEIYVNNNNNKKHLFAAI